MKTRVLFILAVIIICTLLAAFILSGCPSDFMWHRPPWPPWPTDYSGIFSEFIADPADDFAMISPEQPPYPVSYPPVDVTQLSFGVQGHYFYVRVDYVDVIPTAPVDIPEAPPIEAQTVNRHNTFFYLDVDNDGSTGGTSGAEVSFGIGFKYGQGNPASYSYHPDWSDLNGEFGEGGPGHKYVIVRYNIEKLGSLFPRGANVRFEGWSNAESVDSSGNVFYQDFAVDYHNTTTLTLP